MQTRAAFVSVFFAVWLGAAPAPGLAQLSIAGLTRFQYQQEQAMAQQLASRNGANPQGRKLRGAKKNRKAAESRGMADAFMVGRPPVIHLQSHATKVGVDNRPAVNLR